MALEAIGKGAWVGERSREIPTVHDHEEESVNGSLKPSSELIPNLIFDESTMETPGRRSSCR